MSGLRPNRIDRPGTAEESWASWLELRQLPAADPLAWASVVVVAAHPDDEVLGVGGTMAMLAGAGAGLRLIAVRASLEGDLAHQIEQAESEPGLAGSYDRDLSCGDHAASADSPTFREPGG